MPLHVLRNNHNKSYDTNLMSNTRNLILHSRNKNQNLASFLTAWNKLHHARIYYVLLHNVRIYYVILISFSLFQIIDTIFTIYFW